MTSILIKRDGDWQISRQRMPLGLLILRYSLVIIELAAGIALALFFLFYASLGIGTLFGGYMVFKLTADAQASGVSVLVIAGILFLAGATILFGWCVPPLARYGRNWAQQRSHLYVGDDW